MKKSLTFLAVLVAMMSLSVMASAQDKPKVQDAFGLGQKAVEVAGAKITKTSPAKPVEGKMVKVLESSWTVDKLRNRFMDMLKTGEDVDGGRVVGMAYLTHSKSWNISIRKGDLLTVVNFRTSGKGTEIRLRKPIEAPIVPDVPEVPEVPDVQETTPEVTK